MTEGFYVAAQWASPDEVTRSGFISQFERNMSMNDWYVIYLQYMDLF